MKEQKKKLYCINIIEVRESDYQTEPEKVYVVRNAYRRAANRKALNSIIAYMKKKGHFKNHDESYGSVSVTYYVDVEEVKEEEHKKMQQLSIFDFDFSEESDNKKKESDEDEGK